MKETQIDDGNKIWSALKGRRIVLAGLKNKQREFYQTNLIHISRQKNRKLTVTEQAEKIESGDLVLIFAQLNEQGNSDGSEEWKVLLETLDILYKKKPEAAVMISDCAVYGKFFGKMTGEADCGNRQSCLEKEKRPRRVKETELGYISHTAKTETALQYMRMAEHLVCRLAKEEQIALRVVRQTLREEKENLEQMMEALLLVLLYGRDGEIYNLPASGIPFTLDCAMEAASEATTDFEYPFGMEKSPLSPIVFDADIQKIKGLISD